MSHKPGRKGVASSLRQRVRQGKGGAMLLSWVYTLLRDPCVYCGEPGSNSIDHIRPKSDGGRTEWENLAPCHSKCNAQKGTYGVLFAQTQALPKEKET